MQKTAVRRLSAPPPPGPVRVKENVLKTQQIFLLFQKKILNKVGEIEGEIRVLGKVVLAQRNPSPQSKLRGAPLFWAFN